MARILLILDLSIISAILLGVVYLMIWQRDFLIQMWRVLHSFFAKDSELKAILTSMTFANTSEVRALDEKYERRKEILLFLKRNPMYRDAPSEWLEQIVDPAPNSYAAVNKILDGYR